MAPGVEKVTSKMKHPLGGSHDEGGSHTHEEGKSEATHSPVLIDQPGAAQSGKLDGSGLRVAIVASRWYEKVVHSLVSACSEELLAKGVAEDDLHLVEVAGSFEIPHAAARLIHCKDMSHRPDAVICIGCLVNDATHMCETMGHAVANGIMKLNLTSDTPVIYGVLCCDSEAQAQSCAEKRSCCGAGEDHKCNHGVAWAQSALEMAHLKRCMSAKKGEHCSCTRCVSRGKRKSEKHDSGKYVFCMSCGSSAKECTCKDCGCQVCCDHRGECASCKSSAENCSCKDCKCRSCCAKRKSCRGCGCPPEKCSCKDCNCAACSSKEVKAGTKKIPTPTSEHATKQTGSVGEHSGKHEASSSSAARGGSRECASCGSPGGQCKCGLLQ
ncbi:hypothetical protein V7S43_017294 [Phytophthora oleae]|uniref:6,7-dimethyl-8-ribityllumazine synthase n=1 Tax=Phytophthora oleae TaxID=2107226 RepID=A0ABD3EU70_9STRA